MNEVEILLVEDNPTDAELTLRALKKRNLANRVHCVKDGAEALDFLFCTGAYAERAGRNAPRLVLLDLKLPKGWTGSKCWLKSNATPGPEPLQWWC
jgi:two-component system response regulator